MGNVLRILKRDTIRLLKSPAAVIVVLVLLVLPSAYTWYNVLGFWNPYDNTGNLRVGVVNLDEGATVDVIGDLDVGKSIVDALLENDELDWVEEDYDTAMADLRSGDLYAVYVIPSDFSACIVSPLSGDIQHPQLRYYVNEKLGPVAPKITDTGATTLEETINSKFVETVSDVAVQTVDASLQDAKVQLDSKKSEASASVDEAIASVADVRRSLGEIEQATSDAKGKVSTARTALEDADAAMADSASLLKDVTDQSSSVQAALSTASSDAVSKLPGVLQNVSQVSSDASTAARGFSAATGAAQADVSQALAEAQSVVSASSALAADLQAASDAMEDGDPGKAELAQAASDLSSRSSALQGQVDSISNVNTSLAETSQSVLDASDDLDSYTQRSVDAAQQYSNVLFGNVVPAVNDSLSQLSTTCADLSTAASNEQVVISQARLALDQLDSVLDNSASALSQTDGLMSGVQGDLDTITSDLSALGQSGVISDLVQNGTLNSQSISDFMGSPTQLETVTLYPINSYGTGMAPLFMNLTFWIGAFMLMVIMRQEVDSEGIPGITLWQRYLARFLFFCGMVAVQAAICCAGLLYLGVQVASVPALFAASIAAALAYLSIIYALSVTLKHIGKGLCIALVFAQIPGASGIYPIELTSSFFRGFYPLLPFTYGIDAIRESIGGFYGTNLPHDLAILGIMFVSALVLGMLLQPAMSNVNRMTAGQIRESDLFNGEDVQTPARPYRFSQLVHVLSDREEFREDLLTRYGKFRQRYPWFIRGAIVLGIGVPVVFVLLFALTPTEKEVLLTITTVWLVALLVFLVVVESLRYSFERQLHADNMSDDRLLDFYSARERMVPANIKVTSSNLSVSEIIRRGVAARRSGARFAEDKDQPGPDAGRQAGDGPSPGEEEDGSQGSGTGKGEGRA